MKWIEIIKLQVADSDRESVKHELSKLISKIDHKGGLYNVKAYYNALVSSDLIINLYWEDGKVEPQGSATGLGLIYVLKTFGLTSHSVWIEQ